MLPQSFPFSADLSDPKLLLLHCVCVSPSPLAVRSSIHLVQCSLASLSAALGFLPGQSQRLLLQSCSPSTSSPESVSGSSFLPSSLAFGLLALATQCRWLGEAIQEKTQLFPNAHSLFCGNGIHILLPHCWSCQEMKDDQEWNPQ